MRLSNKPTKIGTSFWFGHRPFREKIEEFLGIGFEYFEIALDFPFPEKNEELKEVIKESGINPAFHAPLDILLASPREEIFKASMKVLEKCLKFVEKFETLYFNFHASHLTSTFLFPEICEIGIKNLEKAINFAVKIGKNAGFEVCLENNTLFGEELIVGDVKITLDLGHFAIEAKRWGKDYIRELIDFCNKYANRILVMHVHDFSFASMCDHLPLGKGEIDFKTLKYLLKEKVIPKYVLLEIFWKDTENKVFASSFDLKKSFELLKPLI